MSRIVESLYRISGIVLTEENHYFEKDIFNNLPRSIKLEDGYKFTVPYSDNLSFKSGDYAFKRIHIPFSTEEDAEQFIKDHNLSVSDISYDNNGEIYIEYDEVYVVKLIGLIVDFIINQYEGKTISNKFKNFPLSVSDIPYYIGDSKHDLLNNAKQVYGNIQWPSNIGIESKSIKYKKYIFEVIKQK